MLACASASSYPDRLRKRAPDLHSIGTPPGKNYQSIAARAHARTLSTQDLLFSLPRGVRAAAAASVSVPVLLLSARDVAGGGDAALEALARRAARLGAAFAKQPKVEHLC